MYFVEIKLGASFEFFANFRQVASLGRSQSGFSQTTEIELATTV